MPSKKQRRIAEETRAVYVPLAERLGIHIWKTELEELCSKYLNGYAYKVAVEQNHQTAESRKRNLRYIKQYFRTMIVDWKSGGAVQEISMEEEPVHTLLHRWAERLEGEPPMPV